VVGADNGLLLYPIISCGSFIILIDSGGVTRKRCLMADNEATVEHTESSEDILCGAHLTSHLVPNLL
jgi:hypothetical protein